MKPFILSMLTLPLLISYLLSNLTGSISNHNPGLNSVYNPPACVFTTPDSSVMGIKIRNAESLGKALGSDAKLEGGNTYIFYSKDHKEELQLIVFPGDNNNQVSIFKVTYFGGPEQKFKALNANIFETEKGIKLGMDKNEVVSKLGDCYTVMGGTADQTELHYAISSPDDSKTKLLKHQNMPSYYADYRFKNNKLVNFEFGFDYP